MEFPVVVFDLARVDVVLARRTSVLLLLSFRSLLENMVIFSRRWAVRDDGERLELDFEDMYSWVTSV